MFEMKLDERKDLITVAWNFNQVEQMKQAGFGWDSENKYWATPFASVAKKIAPNDEVVHRKTLLERTTTYNSTALYSNISVPTPRGFSFKPYQLAGISFMFDKRNVLLADQMGLGKTIQAIGLVNKLTEYKPEHTPFRVLVICPASLKINWQKEWDKWCTATDVKPVIVNYDRLTRERHVIHTETWDVLIIDECQYVKNSKAKRTQEVVGYRNVPGIRAKRKIAITGTPILNRPIELYPVLHYLQPMGYFNKFHYAQRYCDAKKTPFGWDFSGYSNLEELQEKLRSTIMIRRLKSEVLPDLPGKVRQIIEIQGDKTTKNINQIEKKWFSELFKKKDGVLTDGEFRAAIKQMQTVGSPVFEEMSEVRKETALAKIPAAIEHIQNSIDSSGKVIVFCHHKEVVQAIHEKFKEVSVVLTGSTPLNKRDEAVKLFQTDPKTHLFVGNIKAAGTGLTLTASSHVIFVEMSWTPGDMAQAEDRADRIGQKNSVLVQILVLKDSLDSLMAKTIVRKQELIERAVDEKEDEILKQILQ